MEAVFFDLDGTLVDSRTGIERCIAYALNTMGVQSPSSDSFRQYIGPPLQETFRELLGSGQANRVEEAVGLYRKRFETDGIYEAELYPGVVEMLEQIQLCGWPAFVVTSKPVNYASDIVSNFALSGFFKNVYGSEPSGRLARKEKLIRYVLKKENLFPGEVIMIGDRLHDVLGAQINFVQTIGVSYGYGSKEELQTAGANWICDSPAEVLTVLQNYVGSIETS